MKGDYFFFISMINWIEMIFFTHEYFK